MENGSAAGRDPLAIAPEVKSSIRIFIVEDDRTLREGLTITLQAEGYNITVASAGDEAEREEEQPQPMTRRQLWRRA